MWVSIMIRGKYDVLLTYGWCRVGYIVLRSLAHRGLKVLVGDDAPVGMCQASRLKSGFFRYPSPWTRPKHFVKRIKEVFEESGARIIIAPHEESYLLVNARDQFPENALAAYSSWETIDLLNNKLRSASLAQSLEIPRPRTIELNGHTDFGAQVSRAGMSYPLVVKLKRGNSAKGVFYPGSKEELEQCVNRLIKLYKLSSGRYPIVQEFVHGEGWGVSGVWDNGRPLALVTHRRLREKTATGGTSTLREVLPNTILEQYTIKLMQHVKWHGAAMVEYKYNPETRQAWFIEVNPRLWGSLALPVAAGLDIPWILYNLALGNPVNRATPKSGIKSRWLLGDLIAAAGLAGGGEIKAALKALMPIKGAVYDDWFLDDPMVLAGEAGCYGWKFIKSGLSANPVEQGMLG